MTALRSIMSAATIAAVYMTTQTDPMLRAVAFAMTIVTNAYFAVDRLRAKDTQMAIMYVVFFLLSILGVYNNL
jgi:hypothetical protein